MDHRGYDMQITQWVSDRNGLIGANSTLYYLRDFLQLRFPTTEDRVVR